MTFAETKSESVLGHARVDGALVNSVAVEGGGRDATPATDSRGFLARYRNSVWAPVLVKIAGIGLGLLALSGIGALAMLRPSQGFDLLHGDAALQKDIHGAWLAGSTPKPTPSSAPAPPAQPVTSQASDGGADSAVTKTSGLTPDGKVILNLASAEELTRLPGVGAKRAQRIIELRSKLGRFRKLTDLLRVRGIGAKGLRRMLPHLILDPPPSPS